MKSAALLRNPVRNVILTVFLLLAGVQATNCAKKRDKYKLNWPYGTSSAACYIIIRLL